MFQSIKSKLILLLSGLLIFSVLAGLVATDWIVATSQRNNTLEALGRTEQVVNTLLEAQRINLLHQSQLVGILPILATVVENGDPATILNSSKSYQEQLEIPIFDVLNDEGELLVSVKNNFPKDENPQSRYLKEQTLEEGKVLASLTIRQQQLALITTAPVGLPEEPSGILMVGSFLDHDFAQKIKNLTNADISFLIEHRITGSSLSQENQESLLKTLQGEQSDSILSDKGVLLDIGSHLLQIKPLKDIHDKLVGQLVIQFSLAEAKAVLKNIRYLLLGIGLGVFVVAIVLGFLFTLRTLIRPINRLQETALQLTNGHLDQPIDVSRTDELGYLAQSFADMRDAIRKKITDLRILNETGALLAGLSDPIRVLKIALHIMHDKMRVEIGSVYLLNQEGFLTLKAFYPALDQIPHPPQEQFKVGEGIVGKSAEQVKTIYISDTSKSTEYASEFENEPKALLCIPLLDGQEVFGVMNFSGKAGQVFFEDADEEFAKTIIQMTIATYRNIENGQLAIENLKKADKLKDEFLANTSHELRTPLNGIIGLSESLLDGVGGAVTSVQNQNLSMIIQSGKRLAGLINDILDFSKMKNKELQLQLKPVDIKSIANVVLALSKPLIGQKPVNLINAVPRALPLVQADENRLQQILLNLVGNAVKFTHEGNVTVSAESSSTDVRISISDTGIGISPENQEQIFKSFEQAEGSTAREYGGTGLGLTITKQMIELHGGTIEVESTVNQGSTFFFSLPIAEDQLRETNSSPDTLNFIESQESQEELLVESEDMEFADTPEFSLEENAQTLLIVDDEPVNIQVLTNQLTLRHYRILSAQDGFSALETLKTEQPDMVLLDLMMPRMSGYEVCQKIRESYDASTMPVLMITAKNQVNDLLQGMDSGANDYLVKPFNKDELLARITTHLLLSQITRAYERFVPREYVKILNKKSIIDVSLGDHQQRFMTILFSDIRSFTTLSEQMTPKENFNFLNAYLKRMGPVVRKYNGFIDKYIGDAIMAIFDKSADDAVKAAIVMLHELDTYNQHRESVRYPPIKIGIGINSGELMLGTVGERHRMEGSVISDAVNVASRLEGLTKIYRVPLLISEGTYSGLKNPDDYFTRFIDRVRVKGKTELLSVYEVFDHDPPEIREGKLATKKAFERAWLFYQSQDFSQAQKIFQSCLDQLPQDEVSRIYIERCQQKNDSFDRTIKT